MFGGENPKDKKVCSNPIDPSKTSLSALDRSNGSSQYDLMSADLGESINLHCKDESTCSKVAERKDFFALIKPIKENIPTKINDAYLRSIKTKAQDNSQTSAKETSTLSLSFCQWNGRSYQTQEKLNFISSIDADLFCLQEVFQRLKELETIGDILCSKLRDTENGGGTVVLKSLNVQSRSKSLENLK